MIKAVIIEDEKKNTRILKQMLHQYCPKVIVCGDADSIDAGYTLIKNELPQLVFLDVEIVGGNAFSLLDKLQPINFQIIFITAFDSYSIKAIKYSALDYLLKPVNISELILSVNKAAEKLNHADLQQRIEMLLHNINQSKQNFNSISIPASFGFEFILLSSIIRCESFGNYTNFFLTDGKKIVSIKCLKDYEAILPADFFFRIHNSHIINVNYAKRFLKGRISSIEMSDKVTIPVAQRRKNEFLQRFNIDS